MRKEPGNTLDKLLKFDNLITKAFIKNCFIGIDEVGRGSLAGPVIACAFSWKKDINKNMRCNATLQKLNDSKRLNKNERNKLYLSLMEFGDFGIGYGSVQEIEKLNILNATFLAMKRAFENLLLKIENLEPYILIDGNKFNPYINCRQLPVVHGDAKSSLIASASIIAKVYRDGLMYRVAKLKKYKRYGWLTNVGYGTKFHRDAIKKHGLTPLHRKLFVRKVLKED